MLRNLYSIKHGIVLLRALSPPDGLGSEMLCSIYIAWIFLHCNNFDYKKEKCTLVPMEVQELEYDKTWYSLHSRIFL